MNVDIRWVARDGLRYTTGGCRSSVPHVVCNGGRLVLWMPHFGFLGLLCPRLATSLIGYWPYWIAIVTSLVVRLGGIVFIHRDFPSNPGPLFAKRATIFPQKLINYRSREIWVWTFTIALKFDGHLGSSDTIIITSNLAASSHHEIWW